MLDFKLEYFFTKYKDTPIIPLEKFRKKFKDENGEFTLFKELIIMIQKYQYKKYGDLINNKVINVPAKEGIYSIREKERIKGRFGTNKERTTRKINYDRGVK